MKLPLTLIVLAGLVTLSPPAGVQAAPGAQTLYEKDRGRTVTLKLEDRLILHLRNPRSGGYETDTPLFDSSVLKLVSQKEVPPEASPGPRLGDFGKFFYEWEAVGSGETDIVINIHRPWEKKPPQEYWRVKVKVSP